MKSWKFNRKSGLVFSAVLLLATVGCSGNSTGTVRSASQTEESTEVTTAQVAERYSVDFGEAATQADITMTIDHAYLTSYTITSDEEEIAILFYQVTITNNSDSSISANYLSGTFYGAADGVGYATTGLRSIKYITRQFGEDAEYFSESIQAGETRQGYVYLELPADFEEAMIIFYPGAGSGDYSIAYSVTTAREDLEEAPEPVTPFDE